MLFKKIKQKISATAQLTQTEKDEILSKFQYNGKVSLTKKQKRSCILYPFLITLVVNSCLLSPIFLFGIIIDALMVATACDLIFLPILLPFLLLSAILNPVTLFVIIEKSKNQKEENASFIAEHQEPTQWI